MISLFGGGHHGGKKATKTKKKPHHFPGPFRPSKHPKPKRAAKAPKPKAHHPQHPKGKGTLIPGGPLRLVPGMAPG